MKKKKRPKKISVKVRRTWAINPVTKVGDDAKKYDRRQEKQIFRKSVQEDL